MKKTPKLYEYMGDVYSAQREFDKAYESYCKAFDLYMKQSILH